MPTSIANGATVSLECGRTYQGTLDLRGKSNVTVRTAGACGNAILSPGQAITGWTRHEGNIFSAPISFEAAQVIIDGRPIEKAHWPARSQTWAKASSSNADSLSYSMPNGDLAGATLVFKPYEWAIEARRITGYSGSTMALASTGSYSYDGYALGGQVEFYVEGKLWMLDEPGEWAVNAGRLYVWTPDGQSPEGRVWASPDKDGIDAASSSGVSIEGVSIYGAANGINALDASSLRVHGVHITNASANGIQNNGGRGLNVDGAVIRNVRNDAISVHWGGGNEVIKNSRIDASGSIGMPNNARAAINLTVTTGAHVENNTVTNSGYIGIRVFRNATVLNNTVDGACLVLTDCGGIFTSARDKQPLNTKIERNTIKNVGRTQRLAWGVYLGDYANGATVTGNIITGNGNGMEIYNGFDNVISNNEFSNSTQAHVQMVEAGTASSVTNNSFTGNTFTSVNGEETYRNSSDLGTSALSHFGRFDGNTYISSSSVFANYNGAPLSFAEWKSRTGQEATSTFRTP